MKRSVSQPKNISAHEIKKCEHRLFNATQAREMLPIVRKISERAVSDLAPIQKKLNNMVPADPRIAGVKASYEKVVLTWAGKMERLGLKVHGLWQVGFDCGDGWLGWQHPERSIRYFIEYGAIFSEKQLQEQRKAHMLRFK